MRVLDPQYNEATGGDTSPPVLHITTPAADGMYVNVNSVAIAGDASEDSSAVTAVEWSLDNANWNSCVLVGAFPSYTWSSTATSLAVGLNTIYVRATNAAALTTTVTRTVYYDNSAPTVSFVTPVGNSGTYNTDAATVDVTGTSTDSESGITATQYSTDNANWYSMGGTLTAWSQASIALVLGANTVYVRSTNGAGTTNTASITVNRLVPVTSGMIVLWNESSPPAGWVVCDGTNGTPDLRDKFIVGAGGTPVPAMTDGDAITSASAILAVGKLTSTTALTCYYRGSTLYGRVLTLSGTTYSAGTELSSGVSSIGRLDMVVMSSTSAIAIYQGASQQHWAVGITIAGGVPTFGTPVSLDPTLWLGSGTIGITTVTSTLAMAFWPTTGGGGFRVRCLSLSGNTVTVPSPYLEVVTNNANGLALLGMDATHAIMVGYFGGTAYVRGYTLTISGTTISADAGNSLWYAGGSPSYVPSSGMLVRLSSTLAVYVYFEGSGGYRALANGLTFNGSAVSCYGAPNGTPTAMFGADQMQSITADAVSSTSILIVGTLRNTNYKRACYANVQAVSPWAVTAGGAYSSISTTLFYSHAVASLDELNAVVVYDGPTTGLASHISPSGAVGVVGGANTHSDVAHTHSVSGHAHAWSASGANNPGPVLQSTLRSYLSFTTDVSSAYHTHTGGSATVVSDGGAQVSGSGNAGTIENRPPYRAQHFIMKS